MEEAFEPPGKRHYRIRVAEDQFTQSDASVNQAIYQILSQVRQTYTAWIASLAKGAFAVQNMKAYQSIANVAVGRFQRGEVQALDIN